MSPRVQDVEVDKAMMVQGKELYGTSLYFSLDFAVNLNLPLKNKFYFLKPLFNTSSRTVFLNLYFVFHLSAFNLCYCCF